MKKGHELNQGKRSPTMIERMNEKLHVKRFKEMKTTLNEL